MAKKCNYHCSYCKNTRSSAWKKNCKGHFACRLGSVRPSINTSNSHRNTTTESTRTRSGRNRQHDGKENTADKGRRKKSHPQKSPLAKVKIGLIESAIRKKQLHQIGDVVWMTDLSGNKKYGQIQGIVINGNGEKSASILWLKKKESKDHYDPHSFVHLSDLALDEEQDVRMVKLEYLNFAFHAPLKYYQKLWDLAKNEFCEKICIKMSEQTAKYLESGDISSVKYTKLTNGTNGYQVEYEKVSNQIALESNQVQAYKFMQAEKIDTVKINCLNDIFEKERNDTIFIDIVSKENKDEFSKKINFSKKLKCKVKKSVLQIENNKHKEVCMKTKPVLKTKRRTICLEDLKD